MWKLQRGSESGRVIYFLFDEGMGRPFTFSHPIKKSRNIPKRLIVCVEWIVVERNEVLKYSSAVLKYNFEIQYSYFTWVMFAIILTNASSTSIVWFCGYVNIVIPLTCLGLNWRTPCALYRLKAKQAASFHWCHIILKWVGEGVAFFFSSRGGSRENINNAG